MKKHEKKTKKEKQGVNGFEPLTYKWLQDAQILQSAALATELYPQLLGRWGLKLR